MCLGKDEGGESHLLPSFHGDLLIYFADQLLGRNKGPLRMCAGKRDCVDCAIKIKFRR